MSVPQTKRHVLLIDDDATIRRIFASKLKGPTVEVLHANSGVEGLEIAHNHHPDLILLDVDMPGMDGYEVANRLKSDASTKAIPVMFLTNEDFSVEAVKAFKELGITEYLPKAGGLAEIVEAVRKALG